MFRHWSHSPPGSVLTSIPNEMMAYMNLDIDIQTSVYLSFICLSEELSFYLYIKHYGMSFSFESSTSDYAHTTVFCMDG